MGTLYEVNQSTGGIGLPILGEKAIAADREPDIVIPRITPGTGENRTIAFCLYRLWESIKAAGIEKVTINSKIRWGVHIFNVQRISTDQLHYGFFVIIGTSMWYWTAQMRDEENHLYQWTGSGSPTDRGSEVAGFGDFEFWF